MKQACYLLPLRRYCPLNNADYPPVSISEPDKLKGCMDRHYSQALQAAHRPVEPKLILRLILALLLAAVLAGCEDSGATKSQPAPLT
jgi:hypothetical protein